MYQIFQRLVKLAGIETFNCKRISPYDMRRLLLSIMTKDLKINSVLADSCLSHKKRGTLKHYISFDDNDIAEAFYKYWELIIYT